MGFLASNFSTSTSWLVIIMIDLEFFWRYILTIPFCSYPTILAWTQWLGMMLVSLLVYTQIQYIPKNSVRKGSRSDLHVENSAYQKIEEINDADFCHSYRKEWKIEEVSDICRFLIVLIISNLLSWDKMFTHTFRVGQVKGHLIAELAITEHGRCAFLLR